MLTQALRTLERDGLVCRSVTPSVPVRGDDALTPLGLSLLPVMRAIKDWAETHIDEVADEVRLVDESGAQRDVPGDAAADGDDVASPRCLSSLTHCAEGRTDQMRLRLDISTRLIFVTGEVVTSRALPRLSG
ncbi:helix-turn-helix domain-containing protein [Nonomuraea sp. NPDC004580]|uniref:winged helix-turn-helix transcriptional regulator n=1 Tax=Nonomuraea sp. NPDC004580 TaxID=3154552 RepID=UPI0033A0489A